jgi:hypothetical protein
MRQASALGRQKRIRLEFTIWQHNSPYGSTIGGSVAKNSQQTLFIRISGNGLKDRKCISSEKRKSGVGKSTIWING